LRSSEILHAWWKILNGEKPALSVEITKACPLHCPGCYAYGDAHLGGGVTLRGLQDYKGDELVRGILNLAERFKPLHISIVGGDPLVRFRELEALVPALIARGIHVQIVTSAFRALPAKWAAMERLTVAVSIDGLQPEHDARRAPATYDRILKNIAGQRVAIHCTITGQMMKQPGYLRDFLQFWTPRPEVARVWFSMFTPQRGDESPEILTRGERDQAIAEMYSLRRIFPKLDMPAQMIRQFAEPPRDPSSCIFAQTTRTISADLKTEVEPCQFGGDPDCSRCGCAASMGLAAVGAHKLSGIIPVGAIFRGSLALGKRIA